MLKLAQEHGKKPPITSRPADLLKPEWEALRSQALALEGCNGSDEDVLTSAMFPQVAAKFFATRHLGPKNLGKDPLKAEPAPAPAAGATAASNQTNPQNYVVTMNGKEHRVTVAPAK